MSTIQATMAGNIWKILVGEGEDVFAGQDVVILESMKMEIPISIKTDGTIKTIRKKEGEFVNEGDTILEYE